MTAVMMDVVEEHLDEATWLWGMWERALVGPDYDLADTAELEERLLAHVDGLSEGGVPVAEALLIPGLESEESARVSVATLALLQASPPSGDVRALLLEAGPAQRPAVRRALEVCEREDLGDALLPLLRHEDVGLQATVLEALVFRDEAPGAVLANFLMHEDARGRVAALRGLCALPRSERRDVLPQLLAAALPGIQEALIETGLTLGLRNAWEACQKAMRSNVALAGRELLVLWAMGGGEEEVTLLMDLLRTPERRADALWALGFSGQVAAADACLAWLEDGVVARLAAEAFSSITGLQMEGNYVLPPLPSREEPIPLEDEDLDADLSPRPEDDLPVPHPDAVASWWNKERSRFGRGTRYLMGHPFQGEVLWSALERGPMRRRHVWARELAIRSGGIFRIPTYAPTRRQQAALQRARAGVAHLPVGSFSRLSFG